MGTVAIGRWLGLVLCLAGCSSNQGSLREVDNAHHVRTLELEVGRLRGVVAQLSQRLEEQSMALKNLSVASETLHSAAQPTVPPCSAESNASLESELRKAQHALARVIERLDVDPETKREMLRSMRPARNLDTENPWVATQ